MRKYSLFHSNRCVIFMSPIDLRSALDELGKLIVNIKTDCDVSDVENLMSKNLFEDIGFDSLDFINLLFQVEEKFKFKIPEPDIDGKNLVNVGTLGAYIVERT